MASKKQKNQGLGRQLVRDQRKERKATLQNESTKHTTDLEPTRESILDQNDLDAIIAHAELSGKKFIAEKQRAVIISREIFQVDAVDPKRIEEMEKHWNDLTIPKRPKWDASTTPEELKQKENEYFIEWRRSLAQLEQNEHLLLTPFEKNPEVWRQLWRVVERSSVVVQIVDARNPLLFRSIDLEKWVISLGKRTLLLVNKADYLTEKQREYWADFFKQENIDFVFFSATASEDVLNVEKKDYPSKIYSRNELLDVFIEECKKLGDRAVNDGEKYTVGMVGYPNVGKSSTINVLLEEKKVAVSKTPGKTKHFQTINLPDRPVTLCDCPGLVFPTFMATRGEMVCNGLIRIAELKDVISPISFVCKKIPRTVLEKTYGIMLPVPKSHEDPNRPPTAEELLNSYGYIRGFMTRHGSPDQARAGKCILEDFASGKLLYCNPPPNCSPEEFKPVFRNISQFSEILDTNQDSGEENEEIMKSLENPKDMTNLEDIDLNLGGVDISTFEVIEERDPNDHRKLETGRKQQRRIKQKVIMSNPTGVYVAGKKHENYTGLQQVGNKGLPTNIKLMGGKRAALGKPKISPT